MAEKQNVQTSKAIAEADLKESARRVSNPGRRTHSWGYQEHIEKKNLDKTEREVSKLLIRVSLLSLTACFALQWVI